MHVYCDVQGTLLNRENTKVQLEVMDMLQSYEVRGSVIRLWTGGELDEFRRKLQRLGVTHWPLLSKYDFKGREVEVAIDDLPEWKLRKDYGIRARKYIHWDPDGIWK